MPGKPQGGRRPGDRLGTARSAGGGRAQRAHPGGLPGGAGGHPPAGRFRRAARGKGLSGHGAVLPEVCLHSPGGAPAGHGGHAPVSGGRRGGQQPGGPPADRLAAGSAPDRGGREQGGRVRDPGPALRALVDVPCLVRSHRGRAAVRRGGRSGQAAPGQKAGGVGTGVLPAQPGPGGPEAPLHPRGAGRAGAAEPAAE